MIVEKLGHTFKRSPSSSRHAACGRISAQGDMRILPLTATYPLPCVSKPSHLRPLQAPAPPPPPLSFSP